MRILNHPYLAPFTEPFKMAARISFAPMRPFLRALKSSYDPSAKDLGWTGIIGAAADDIPMMGMMLFVGTALCTLGAAGAGAVIAGSAATGFFGVIGAGLLGFTTAGVLGMIAGPFCTAMSASAVVATVGIPLGLTLGFLKGCGKAVAAITNAQPVAASTPHTSQPYDAVLDNLPPAARARELQRLQDKFAGTAQAPAIDSKDTQLSGKTIILPPRIRIRSDLAS